MQQFVSFCAVLLTFFLLTQGQDNLGRWRIRHIGGSGNSIYNDDALVQDDITFPDVDILNATFYPQSLVTDPTGGFYVLAVTRDNNHNYDVMRIQKIGEEEVDKPRNVSTLYGNTQVQYNVSNYDEDNARDSFSLAYLMDKPDMAINRNGSVLYFLDYSSNWYTCIRRIDIGFDGAESIVSDYVGVHGSGGIIDTTSYDGTDPTVAPTLSPSVSLYYSIRF